MCFGRVLATNLISEKVKSLSILQLVVYAVLIKYIYIYICLYTYIYIYIYIYLYDLETYFKSYDGTIYTQTDGTPIGKAISGPMAGIYLRWFEYTFIRNSEFNSQILLWKRMRDDVLIVWKKCVSFDLQDLKTYLNSIEERVQWTMDLEERRQLPFTDI